MSVMFYRLLSGEEIIGKQIDSGEGTFTVQKPSQLLLTPDGKGSKLIPFAIFTKTGVIEISQSNVLFSFEPITELVNEYNKMYGTGIVTATKPQLIT